MIALRDEVELEYADRMEELRDMYRSEMDQQNEKFEAEKNKLRSLEASLQVVFSFKIFYEGPFTNDVTHGHDLGSLGPI